MDEQEFRTRSNDALDSLYRKLSAASERHEFEPDFNSGALSIEFEEPKARFVVSPNAPVRQIWVSAHSKSFKLDWNPGKAHSFCRTQARRSTNSWLPPSASRSATK